MLGSGIIFEVEFFLLGMTFIYFDRFNGVSRDIFEQHTVILTKEILAVEQQGFDKFPVDRDAAVFIDLRARKLRYQRVEH